ncbi:hypothetical protein SNEBB_006446 [Seison nebaliae]|nr:hypothetical protein SNEBB_006446 [Seison nebaliae]
MTDSNFGILIDLDGVLMSGETVLPNSPDAMKYLYDSIYGGQDEKDGEKSVKKLPLIFCTNATSLEKSKAEDLSEKLRIKVDQNDLVLAQSPLRNFTKFHDKNVLIIGQGNYREVAKELGFTNTCTVDDIIRYCPDLDMVDHQNRKRLLSLDYESIDDDTLLQPFQKIEAIIVFGEPTNWESKLQIIIDCIVTNGQPDEKDFPGYDNEERNRNEHGQLPLIVCNFDVVFKHRASMPRFGNGAFVVALKHIYKSITQKEMKIQIMLGKPYQHTYEYAENMLNEKSKAFNNECIERLYCIGDNPSVDIVGANHYKITKKGDKTNGNSVTVDNNSKDNSTKKYEVISMLVETGVYQAGTSITEKDQIPDLQFPSIIESFIRFHNNEKMKSKASEANWNLMPVEDVDLLRCSINEEFNQFKETSNDIKLDSDDGSKDDQMSNNTQNVKEEKLNPSNTLLRDLEENLQFYMDHNYLSLDDQERLKSIILKTVSSKWSDMTTGVSDPFLANDEKKMLKKYIIIYTINVCKYLFESCLKNAYVLKDNDVFQQSENVSRLFLALSLEADRTLNFPAMRKHLINKIKSHRNQSIAHHKDGFQHLPKIYQIAIEQTPNRKLNVEQKDKMLNARNLSDIQNASVVDKTKEDLLREVGKKVKNFDFKREVSLPKVLEKTVEKKNLKKISKHLSIDSIPSSPRKLSNEEINHSARIPSKKEQTNFSFDEMFNIHENITQSTDIKNDPLLNYKAPIATKFKEKHEKYQKSEEEKLRKEIEAETELKLLKEQKMKTDINRTDEINLLNDQFPVKMNGMIMPKLKFESNFPLRMSPPVYNHLNGEIDERSIYEMDDRANKSSQIKATFEELRATIPETYLDPETDDYVELLNVDLNLEEARSFALNTLKNNYYVEYSKQLKLPDSMTKDLPDWNQLLMVKQIPEWKSDKEKNKWRLSSDKPKQTYRYKGYKKVLYSMNVDPMKYKTKLKELTNQENISKLSEKNKVSQVEYENEIEKYEIWLDWFKKTMNKNDFCKWLYHQTNDLLDFRFTLHSPRKPEVSDFMTNEQFLFIEDYRRATKEQNIYQKKSLLSKQNYVNGEWNVQTITNGGLTYHPSTEMELDDKNEKDPMNEINEKWSNIMKEKRSKQFLNFYSVDDMQKWDYIFDMNSIPNDLRSLVKIEKSDEYLFNNNNSKNNTNERVGSMKSTISQKIGDTESIQSVSDIERLKRKALTWEEIQKRFEKIWIMLQMPDDERTEMLCKYMSFLHIDDNSQDNTAIDFFKIISDVLKDFEKISVLIVEREGILAKLEVHNNRILEEKMKDSKVNSFTLRECQIRGTYKMRLNKLEEKIRTEIGYIKNKWNHQVTYGGRNYSEKMQWDTVEMMYGSKNLMKSSNC